MAIHIIAILASLTVCTAGSAVHVSPNGDDSGSGSASVPVRTLARGVEIARADGSKRVVVADGRYELSAPLVLTAADSGLVIEAAPGARPIVSAGRRITGWKVGADGVWRVKVPAGSAFSQLYADGVRRERPFLPRKGYCIIDKGVKVEPGANRKFVYREGDIDASWPDLRRIEVRVFHKWSNSRMKIESIDPDSRTVTLGGFKAKVCSDDAMSGSNWYRLENVRAAFGEPGDWYLTDDGELWYRPHPGETPEKTEIVASRLEQALSIDGAEDVTVRGLVFAHADWSLSGGGRYFGQSGFFLPGAVHAVNARNVRIERCAVVHVGSFGIVFAENCRDCAAVDCELYDLGAGGVRIGNGSFARDHKPDAARCVVEDCLVAHYGRVNPVSAGVWTGNSSSNRVSHCTIEDGYYSGISCGWDWTYANRRSHDNVIEWNHVHDIGREVLADLGGIYTLSWQPGTVVRCNFVHDVSRSTYGAYALYFDCCSSHIVATNNIVWRSRDCTVFFQNTAYSNVVENNVFACGRGSQLTITPPSPEARPSRFARNVVCWRKSSLADGRIGPKAVDFESNLCWTPDAACVPKNVRGLVCKDPCFRDWENGDFSFVDEAAVRSVGFVPFSLKGVGKRTPNGLTAGEPPVPDVFEPAPKPQAKPFHDDFEDGVAGNPPRGWGRYPRDCGANVALTDETAAGGRMSLKVTDGTKPAWTPHFCTTIVRSKGKVTLSFAMRLEPGSAPQFELRDPSFLHSDSSAGPYLRADGEGRLYGFDGRMICKVPHGRWVRYTFEFEVGPDKQNSEYSLVVESDPGKAKRFDHLPHDIKFVEMAWAGFVSDGAPGSVYYIDDFSVSEP